MYLFLNVTGDTRICLKSQNSCDKKTKKCDKNEKKIYISSFLFVTYDDSRVIRNIKKCPKYADHI